MVDDSKEQYFLNTIELTKTTTIPTKPAQVQTIQNHRRGSGHEVSLWTKKLFAAETC